MSNTRPLAYCASAFRGAPRVSMEDGYEAALAVARGG